MTDPKRQDVIPVAAELGVHGEARSESVRAEQGPPPADFAERPASGVPVLEGEPLGAEQVTTLTGDASDTADANVALQEAEGLDPRAGG
ncbi:hypothetical protein SAMN04488058_11180 [Deinococcus reticulitermitis]|uniref:Uncharacterized protein n=1 Tax=Deinococcus reticulitermitis TaxID=856736 RepID=A0A1H7A1C1_9DEIO|nr:hypothetical protein [Deinococcus reticulitermitis]SEJ59489.1 hypothetical protein SAMN04488058_11180 [Deinococcus reticulitermitis]